MRILNIFTVLLTGIIFQTSHSAYGEEEVESKKWSIKQFALSLSSPSQGSSAPKEEVALREEVVNLVLGIYQTLNEKGRYPNMWVEG
jgi:hypothetical protein